MKKKEIELFLKDLEKVYRKHNIIISSCGCCNSPWLVSEKNFLGDNIKDAIEHLRKRD